METYYKPVLARLGRLRRELEQLEQRRSALRAQQAVEEQAYRQLLPQQEEELNRQRRRVTAYRDIALQYTRAYTVPAQAAAYDIQQLSLLSLKINRKGVNDPAARELYRAACQQLLGLEAQKEELQQARQAEQAAGQTRLAEKEAELNRQRAALQAEFAAWLKEESFVDFVRSTQALLQNRHNAPAGQAVRASALTVGCFLSKIPLEEGLVRQLASAAGPLCGSGRLRLPLLLPLTAGSVLYAEYTPAQETALLSGLHGLLAGVVQCRAGTLQSIQYVDPLRLDDSALGPLQPLTRGENAAIAPLPASAEEIRARLGAVLESCRSAPAPQLRWAVFLHNYPAGYDAQTQAIIRQLALNAAHYGVLLVITHCLQAAGGISDEDKFLLTTHSLYIRSQENGFSALLPVADGVPVLFEWLRGPSTLPQEVLAAAAARHGADHGNDYAERVGLRCLWQGKGDRRLTDIPYGVDGDGRLQTLSFEDSCFATFLSGASRSGKSTLLHTLLTGLIARHHPDDIEIWLVDFKMTEFSRYVHHTPPHVRYILLDESPELVYDLLDRLSEILTRRQNIFKGKWQKLDEVPKTRYMPAMFILIDEFSVMSQIVADSAVNGREDYRVKLQLLLAKGAALGMHFVFASQGFTSGSRGLNDFAKKQVQQRIAMKTEYNEIRETLDLKTISERDRQWMEQLPVHHALVRVPPDAHGNRLVRTKVLYLSDPAQQLALIDRMCAAVRPVDYYDPADDGVYVDKQTLIVDGGNYHAFDEAAPAMRAALQQSADGALQLYPGEPRRMRRLAPVCLSQGFCENLLLVASAAEQAPAVSVLLSLRRSLQLQQRTLSVLADIRDPVFRQLAQLDEQDDRLRQAVCIGLESVCAELHSLKEQVTCGEAVDRCVALLGLEALVQEMSFCQPQAREPARTATLPGIEKWEPGEQGLLAQLSALTDSASEQADKPPRPTPPEVLQQPTHAASAAYDARGDLAFLLTHGPRCGLHFIAVFRTMAEFGQTKLDAALFRHKMMFAAPKSDAAALMGMASGAVVAGLSDHSFRYTNGLDAMTYRPYLHEGLSWDGWKLENGGAAQSEDDDLLL